MPGSDNEVDRVLDRIKNDLPVSNYKGQKFIPRHDLRECLTRQKFGKVLDYHAIDILKLRTIEKSYLAIFVILWLIGKATSITSFIRRNDLSDAHLPFRNPDNWPDSCKEFFGVFFKLQWEFCAEEFNPDRFDDKELEDQSILPILTQDPLKEGPDSWTYKIQIHPDYNSLTPAGTGTEQQPKYFVLKSCPSNRHIFHHNEVRAYKLLSRHDDIAKHIVGFHGSWKQGDWYHILLEYVEGKTLEEVFREEHPTSEDDRLKFWTNCIRILDPLLRIHYGGDPSSPHELATGAHQDIKPANILVESSRSTSASTFDRIFKLADLGTSYLSAHEKKRKTTQRREIQGTQMFSAPECFRNEDDLVEQRTGRPLDPLKDVWSLACTFSETAVWCVLGAKGLREYRERRAAATKNIPAISQTAYDGCFHNGVTVLHVVQEMHNEVRKEHGAHYTIINEVLPIIEYILNLESRPDIRTVRSHFKRVLDNAATMAKPPIFRPQHAPQPLPPKFPQDKNAGLGLQPMDPSQFMSPVSTNSGRPFSESFGGSAMTGRVGEVSSTYFATQQSSPDISHPTKRATISGRHTSIIPQRGFSKWDNGFGNGQRPLSDLVESSACAKRQSHTPTIPAIAPPSSSTPNTQQYVTMERVLSWSRNPHRLPCPVPETYLNNISRTDQIFIVDTSASMEQYREQIRETFEGLAYLVKKLDMDGIDLHLTTSREKRHGKNRTPMLDLLSSVTYGGETYMDTALSQAWDMSNKKGIRNLIRREKNWRKSIYVFTDGRWHGYDDSLCGIPEVVRSIVAKMSTKQKLGIQFIQFGNDPVGSWRLHELDEGLKKHDVAMDIIDTEPNTGNVYKMLLGHFNSSWDEEPISPGPSQNAGPGISWQLPA